MTLFSVARSFLPTESSHCLCRMIKPKDHFSEDNVTRFLIWFFMLIMAAMLVTLYLVAALEGILVYPSLYISSTYIRDPTRAVAAYMIPLLAFLFVIISTSRLNRLSPFIYRSIDIWLMALLIVSILVFFVGMCGVGAVPKSTLYPLHVVGAIMLFVGGIASLLIFTLLDYRLDLDQPMDIKWYRFGIAITGLATGVVLAITAGVSDITASICEIILAILLVLYVLSWMHESEFNFRSRSLPARLSCLEAEPSSHPPV
jgi:hypothetical protein